MSSKYERVADLPELLVNVRRIGWGERRRRRVPLNNLSRSEMVGGGEDVYNQEKVLGVVRHRRRMGGAILRTQIRRGRIRWERKREVEIEGGGGLLRKGV